MAEQPRGRLIDSILRDLRRDKNAGAELDTPFGRMGPLHLWLIAWCGVSVGWVALTEPWLVLAFAGIAGCVVYLYAKQPRARASVKEEGDGDGLGK